MIAVRKRDSPIPATAAFRSLQSESYRPSCDGFRNRRWKNSSCKASFCAVVRTCRRPAKPIVAANHCSRRVTWSKWEPWFNPVEATKRVASWSINQKRTFWHIALSNS